MSTASQGHLPAGPWASDGALVRPKAVCLLAPQVTGQDSLVPSLVKASCLLMLLDQGQEDTAPRPTKAQGTGSSPLQLGLRGLAVGVCWTGVRVPAPTKSSAPQSAVQLPASLWDGTDTTSLVPHQLMTMWGGPLRKRLLFSLLPLTAHNSPGPAHVCLLVRSRAAFCDSCLPGQKHSCSSLRTASSLGY